jgi:hypothetical protein
MYIVYDKADHSRIKECKTIEKAVVNCFELAKTQIGYPFATYSRFVEAEYKRDFKDALERIFNKGLGTCEILIKEDYVSPEDLFGWNKL